MKKLGSILFIGVLFLSSCSSFFKVEVVVDNPSEQALTFTLDEKSYEIAGKDFQSVKIVKGEHYLMAEQDGKIIFDGTVSITQKGIINLTQSKYILHQELYLKDQANYVTYAEEELNLKDIEIDNKMYQNVDFVVFEDEVFVPMQWDYSFNEDLPAEITTSNGDFEIVSKLYRQEDLEKAWGFNGDFDFSGNSDTDLQAFLDSVANYLQPEIEEVE